MAGRRWSWSAALVTAALALAGCSSSAPPPAPPEPVTVEPTVVVDKDAAPDPLLPDTWPLTGMPLVDAPGRPAVAVKVENTAMARPQTGLEDADIVWEEMVEGGITRFNAVFHSRLPDAVGPIRSLRPMDAGIVAPLGGPQVVSGGQPLFLASVQAEGVQLISNDAGSAGFFRSAERRAPHNLYGRLADFVAQAATAEPPTEQFSFAVSSGASTAVVAGEPAAALRLSFPRTSPGWVWDEAGERWLRDEAGVASSSAAGERLGAENVVVMRVQVVDSAGRDQSGSAVPETVMTGGGEALVASGGHTVRATWDKPTTSAPVTLTTADGTVVELAPGVTWVELVPVAGGDVSLER